MSETPNPPPTPAPTAAIDEDKPSELLEPSDYGEYLLRTRNEIRSVLKALVEHVAQITIFFNEGKDLLLTTLVAIEERGLIFDFGASSEMNRKAQEVGKLFCITSLEKVKVQFILRGLKKIDYQGGPAFLADYPDAVLRLQRREYYRLTMPVTRPLKCLIPLPAVGGEHKHLEVHVVDISGGGMAIVIPPDSLPLVEGTEFTGCTIDLPDVGTVTATVRILSVFEITLRSGAHLRRSGCEFVKLLPQMATLIQRYIIKVERERKAREAGLA
ncbi:MAG: flagellar brake protein [Rhodocyclaceae bacterium]|jgi:c-di-GMP-binding flagellar brake protein YcgR|nr:flagellar brake protein [Rhodocyclaceae bacterium]